MSHFDQMEISSRYSIDARRDVKWSMSMMLPEHVALLRQFNEDIKKIDHPQLDEQELELLDEAIHLAMEEARSVSIAYFVDGKIIEYTGDIHFLNAITQSIILMDRNVGKVTLRITDITGVTLLDKIDIFEETTDH